jgi:hypothetical protein
MVAVGHCTLRHAAALRFAATLRQAKGAAQDAWLSRLGERAGGEGFSPQPGWDRAVGFSETLSRRAQQLLGMFIEGL